MASHSASPYGPPDLGRYDIIGHPGVPEFNRLRRDTRLSPRGRLIFFMILLGIAVAFALLILVTR